MAQISVLSILLCLLFNFYVSANVVPRIASTSKSSSSIVTVTATGPVIFPTATLGACPSIDQKQYATPNGVFLIQCFRDHLGSDIRGDGQVTKTFQMCLDQCAANPQCQSISWMNGSRKCYMKSKIGASKVNNLVWGATWISGPVVVPVISSSTSTSLSKSTSSTVSISSTQSTSQPSLAVVSPTTTSSTFPSYVPSGTESIFSSATTIPGPAPVILGPVAPFDIDMSSLSILVPNIASGLYYSGGSTSSDNSTTGTVAKLSVTFQYLSVVLDHSIYVTSSCSNGVLTATFNDSTAFAQAQSTWPNTTFLLVTAAPSCGVGGQNAFFLAKSVVFSNSGLTAVATGSVVDLANIFSDMGLNFGAIPSNATSSTGGSSTPVNSCGSPSTSTINGLPAVACGSYFDQTLDDSLGYYNGDESNVTSVLAIIAPGAPASAVQRRGFLSALKTVAKVVAPVVKAVAAKAVQTVAPIIKAVIPPVIQKAIVSVATVVAKVATTVVNTALSFLTGSFSQSLNIPISIAPPAAMLLPSPWGQQFKFYEFVLGSTDPSYKATDAALQIVSNALVGEPNPVPGIELFCVDCGIVGNIKVIGSVSISAAKGFYAGTIGMQGNLEAGIFIGVNGFAEWQKEVDASIIKAGLPGFSIPKVVTIGPSLELGISASLTVDAVGQILVGTSYSWPALSASLDVMNSANSVRSGFTPSITRKFEAYGDVTATASIGLPVTLAFGIDFFSGKWSKEISIKDVPSLNAVAEFSLTGGADVTTGPNGTTFSTPISINTNGCNGISWQVNVANEVDLDIGDNIEYTLWQWTGPPLAQGCIGKAAASSSSSSTSSSTTTSSSSATSSTSVITSSTSTTQSSQSTYSTVLLVSQIAPTSIPSSSTQTWASSTVLLVSQIAPTTAITSSTQTSQSASSTVLLVSQISPTTATQSSTSWSSVSSIATTSGTSSTPTSLSTTSTTSASSPTTTSSLGPNDTIDCSVDNGRMFTDAQGYVYQIQCHTDHGADDMGNEMASSFAQCISDCFSQQDHDCIGVVWVPNRSFANCNFKGDRQTLPANSSDSTLGFEVDSAILISAPPCSSLTCPANDAQYCMSNGEMFKISCEIAYMTNQLANLNYATLGECVDACSSQWPGNCTGVVFFPALYRSPTTIGFPESNCYPFEQGNNPVSYSAAQGGQSALTRAARNAGYGLWRRETNSYTTLESRQSTTVTTGNLTYAPVFDTTKTFSLNAADDGNLYVSLINATQSTNTTLAFYDENIIGDSQGRLLHYYPSNIAAVSASRIRLAQWGSIPETAALITLAPFSAGSSIVFVAVDTLGNYFWLYACAIEGQQNKVFLVNDPSNGQGILQNPDLMFTVTGGVVNDCAPLALTADGLQALS